MAGSVNKVILIGNLGKDPEIRRTQDGRPIANLRIATTESWRDKTSGEKREKTEWHSVVIFNEGLCRVAEQYLKKGAKVYIEGALQTRKWQGQDGQDRYSTEVVLQGFNSALTMLDGRGGGAGAGAGMQEDDQVGYSAARQRRCRQARRPKSGGGKGASTSRWTTRSRSDGRACLILAVTRPRWQPAGRSCEGRAIKGRGLAACTLAPLLDAPLAIQLHAFAAMAAFVLGAVQLAAHQGHDPAPRAGFPVGRPDADRGDQLVLDPRDPPVGAVEPDPPAVDPHAGRSLPLGALLRPHPSGAPASQAPCWACSWAPW